MEYYVLFLMFGFIFDSLYKSERVYINLIGFFIYLPVFGRILGWW